MTEMKDSVGISRKLFVVGIVVAILVSSVVSTLASMIRAIGPKGDKGDPGAQGLQGEPGTPGTSWPSPPDPKTILVCQNYTIVFNPDAPTSYQDEYWLPFVTNTDPYGYVSIWVAGRFNLTTNLTNPDARATLRLYHGCANIPSFSYFSSFRFLPNRGWANWWDVKHEARYAPQLRFMAHLPGGWTGTIELSIAIYCYN